MKSSYRWPHEQVWLLYKYYIAFPRRYSCLQLSSVEIYFKTKKTLFLQDNNITMKILILWKIVNAVQIFSF